MVKLWSQKDALGQQQEQYSDVAMAIWEMLGYTVATTG